MAHQMSVKSLSESLKHVRMYDLYGAESQLYSDSKIIKPLKNLTESWHFQILVIKSKRVRKQPFCYNTFETSDEHSSLWFHMWLFNVCNYVQQVCAATEHIEVFIFILDIIFYVNLICCKGPFKLYVKQMGVGGGGVCVSDFLEKSVTKV